MKNKYMFIAGLYTLIQSIVVGIFMVHAAITNNPQGEFYTESGVVWGDIATVFVSRFVGSAVFLFGDIRVSYPFDCVKF